MEDFFLPPLTFQLLLTFMFSNKTSYHQQSLSYIIMHSVWYNRSYDSIHFASYIRTIWICIPYDITVLYNIVFLIIHLHYVVVLSAWYIYTTWKYIPYDTIRWWNCDEIFKNVVNENELTDNLCKEQKFDQWELVLFIN